MNAAVRSVVRTALDKGAEVYAIYEGYQGLVEGGARIRKMDWDAVGGILQRGGTIIGTARSRNFTARGATKSRIELVRMALTVDRHRRRRLATGADVFRLVVLLSNSSKAARSAPKSRRTSHLPIADWLVQLTTISQQITIGTDALHVCR
jgi:hypothetical protein